MSEERRLYAESDLEAALVDLGRHLAHPPAPDLAARIRLHVEQHPRRPRPAWPRPAVLYAVLAAVALLGSLALSPGGRSAIASWFHIAGVRIESGGALPGPLGHGLDLGVRVSLAEAQRRVKFPILVPRDLGPPDETYVGTPPLGGSVSLLYRARPGVPRSAATGAGLLILEYRGTFLDVKQLFASSRVQSVIIRGISGVWIAGVPHVVYDIGPRGHAVPETIRLAGNVLVWHAGNTTIRMEGQIPLKRAVAIAQTMGPSTTG